MESDLRRTVLAVGVVAAALSLACEKPAPPPPPPPEVYVTAVTQRDVPVYLELVGQAKGYQDVDIRARVEGFLETVNFQEGTFVKQGDLLYTIDRKPLEAIVAEGKASQATAEARLSKANNDVTRYTPLVAKQAVSKQELDNALAEQDASKSQVEAAKAAVESKHKLEKSDETTLGMQTKARWYTRDGMVSPGTDQNLQDVPDQAIRLTLVVRLIPDGEIVPQLRERDPDPPFDAVGVHQPFQLGLQRHAEHALQHEAAEALALGAFGGRSDIGAALAPDNGKPVDTSGTLTFGDVTGPFASSKELLSMIAKSEVAQACFATNLHRFATARTHSGAEEAFVALLEDLPEATRGDPLEMLVALAGSELFTLRSTR